MRPSALALPFLAAALACGNGSTPPGACTIPDAGPNALTCQNPIGTSEAAPQAVRYLGRIRVSESANFDVPANTASITIVEQAVAAPETITYQPPRGSVFTLDNTAVPLTVMDPNGTKVYDDTVTPPASATSSLAFFASNSPGTGTITIPNTTRALTQYASGLPAGNWTVTVSDYAYECTFQQAPGACCVGGSTDSTYDVTVIMKPLASGAIPAAGTIDVAIYFATNFAELTTQSGTTAIPLTAATASTDRDLIRMEQTLRLLFSRASITIGSVSDVDVRPDLQAKYATGVNVDQTGSCSDLAQLFRYTGEVTGAGNKLNIFFVSDFKSNSQDLVVVGIDGTIPGPSTIKGSGASAAAVTPADLRDGRPACDASPGVLNLACGADRTAYFIAHEAGHFLGLYHVTESDGTRFDPLAATPMCPCSSCNTTSERCADSTTSTSTTTHDVTVKECTTARNSSCGGGDNLMFWVLDVGSLGTLIDEQARVMRANPLVH